MPFFLLLIALISLAGCSAGNDDESGDKYQYDMGRTVQRAPRITDDEAAGQKLGGAEAVLLNAPQARQDVRKAWFVGSGMGWLAQWSQTHANAEAALSPIRQGLCQIGAGEMHVSADDVCGWGGYLKPEGKWLANTIAPLSLDTSRDFILDELGVAERHACEVLEDYRKLYPNDKIQHPELVAGCDLLFKNRPRNLIVMNGK